MVRYVISLIVFFVGIIPMMALGGSINYFIDLSSFIIIGVFPFLFVSILFGFKEARSAFSEALKQETNDKQLLSAMNFFKVYGKVIWITSFIAMLISFINMLGNIGDENALGYYAAVILISPLYAALINIAVIIPFTIFIKKRIQQ